MSLELLLNLNFNLYKGVNIIPNLELFLRNQIEAMHESFVLFLFTLFFYNKEPEWAKYFLIMY